MARLDALVALVVVGALALPARADVIDLTDTRATIDVPREWRVVTIPGLVLAATASDGRTLAITRAPIPNTDAWREKTRAAYVDRIETGFRGHVRTARNVTLIEGVPVVDFTLTSPRKTTVVVRVILFRTYALALAIEGSRASAIAKTFVPPPSRPEGSP